MSTIGKIGFGTMEYCDGAYPPESAYDAVKLALETGYRTFDTAEAYATVSRVGQALADSAIPREDLFVISKLKGGLPLGPYSAIKERVQKHLRDLQLSQLDLLLIHYPGPESLDFDGPAAAVESSCSMDWFEQHIAEAWKNMTALQTDGLTRHIGVSNFYRGHFDSLQRLIEQDPSLALPFANEIFVDIAHQESDFVSHLQGLGVKVLAYRPIAYCPVYQMAQDMGDTTWSTLDAVARSFSSPNVSPQQVILAELCRRGIVALPKSSQKEHIEANWNSAGISLQNDLVQLGDETLQSLAGLDGNETVDMCGGFDEYAIAFKNVCA